MNDEDDENLIALEEMARRALFGGKAVGSRPRLTEEERRIAARLMGTANADRLAMAEWGRPVRLVPVQEWVEWWIVESGDLRPDAWHLDRIINGRREESFRGTDFEELAGLLADFRRRNVETRRFRRVLDSPAEKLRPSRKSFSERFGRQVPR